MERGQDRDKQDYFYNIQSQNAQTLSMVSLKCTEPTVVVYAAGPATQQTKARSLEPQSSRLA